MGRGKYRFKEFCNYNNFNSGLYGDIDGIKKVIEIVKDESIDKLKNDLCEMSEDMKNDIIDGDIILESNVDLFEFENTKNAIFILYNSIFISLYCFLETRLHFLCKLIDKTNPITLNDISGNGILKYKKYLEKVHKVDFIPVKKEWDRICCYKLLRNKIIHNSSNIINIKSEKNDYNKINQLSCLTIKVIDERAYFFIANKDFLTEFLKIIYNFLDYTCYKNVNSTGTHISR